MNSIVAQAWTDLDQLRKNVPPGKHVITSDIRKLSGRLYRALDSHDIRDVLLLCEALLEHRQWESGVMAFDWAYRVRDQYDESTFAVFDRWLRDYVRGWGDCDDFCTHALGALIRRQRQLFAEVLKWTQNKHFWVRRASAVVLIPAILHQDDEGLFPFQIADALLQDRHVLVQKGYGWMLKCLATVDEESVLSYLTDKHAVMPRTAFRYALESVGRDTRQRMMAL